MTDSYTTTLEGTITAVRVKKTTKGRNIAFVKIVSGGMESEALFFPDLMEKFGENLQIGKRTMLEGRPDDDTGLFLVDEMKESEEGS